MVVDDIQDDLDPGRVQDLDHALELVDVTAGRVSHVGREKADGVVSPIVSQALFHQMAVVHKGMHRHELHGRDAQTLQMLDYRRAGQTGIGPAQLGRDIGMACGESLYVQLVDDGFMPWRSRRMIVVPGERGIDDAAFGHIGGIVAPIHGQILIGMADPVAEQVVVPAQSSAQFLRVGIDQELLGVETMTAGGLVGAVHPVAIEQTGAGFGQVAVPDLVGLLRHRDSLRLTPAACVEDAQLNLLGVLAEQGEIHPPSVPGCPQWVRTAAPYRHVAFAHRSSPQVVRMLNRCSEFPIARTRL